MWKCTAQRSNTQYNAANAWNPKHNEDTFLNKYEHSTFHIVQRVSQHFELSKIKRVTERFIIEICISTSLKEERNNLLDSKLLIFLYTDKSILFLSHNCFPSQCKQAHKKHVKQVLEVTLQPSLATVIKSTAIQRIR